MNEKVSTNAPLGKGADHSITALGERLAAIRAAMARACERSGRAPESVHLLAVSKTWPADNVVQAALAEQTAFGENYLQEALAKIETVHDRLGRALEWHFIGPLQSNKTAEVARHFDWVHSVDRLKIARRLSAQRPAQLSPLSVCVQINISAEASKAGCLPQDAQALCEAVTGLPGLRLRGLMCIPRAVDDAQAARPAFRRLRELAEAIRAAGSVDTRNFDTLSMGMSKDFEVAIEEGATCIRVGSAIFGARNPK